MVRTGTCLFAFALGCGLVPEVAFGGGHPGAVLAAQPAAEAAPDLELKARPAKVKTIAVLVLSGEESGMNISALYGDARKVLEAKTALNVAPLDAIGITVRNEAIRKCAGKAGCFAAMVQANSKDVDLLLMVTASRLEETLLLTFRLVDVNNAREIGAAGDEVAFGMSLLGAMEAQLPDVVPPSIWEQLSSLSVVTEPPNAEVSVSGRSCVSPCEIKRLPPGTYEVAIKKAGFLPWTGTVALAAKQPGTVSAALVEPERGIVSSPLFWGAVVAAVAAAGTLTYFLVRPDDQIVNICIADDPSLCD